MKCLLKRQVAKAFLLYMHAHDRPSRKHALRSSLASVWCALGIWVEKGGIWVVFIVRVKCFVYFHSKNVKVAAQGHYCVSEEKTPLDWLRGWSNWISFITFVQCASIWTIWFVVCHCSSLFCWHFMGKIHNRKIYSSTVQYFFRNFNSSPPLRNVCDLKENAI